MKVYKLADSLKPGDTIIVAQSNILFLAFFAGFGRGTIQFYMPTSVIHGEEKAIKKGVQFNMKFCYKGYINDDSWRVAKVENPIFGDQEDLDRYVKAINILKEVNFIK